jgi:hypothetical protein
MQVMAARPRLASATVLVGIDDTDNDESPGTGRLARMLVQTFEELGLGAALGATRHQLLVDPRIPYTSHNSSVCIALDAGPQPDARAIARAAGDFLERTGADGADPGLAVAAAGDWGRPNARERLGTFGSLAKVDVLNQAAARALAQSLAIHLSPHGGDGGGVIGALAAVGLHCAGTDGRFLWMPGMRDVSGEMTYAELLAAVPIDAALDPTGLEPAAGDLIELGDWVRPILRGGRAVLLLDRRAAASAGDTGARAGASAWRATQRDAVKSASG